MKIFTQKASRDLAPSGNESNPEKNIYNYPLVSTVDGGREVCKGDDGLESGVTEFIHKLEAFKPDIFFMACGADGHAEDPLSNLQYSVEGYVGVATLMRKLYPDTPMLLGGAGGYLPDTRTPEVWAQFACELSV